MVGAMAPALGDAADPVLPWSGQISYDQDGNPVLTLQGGWEWTTHDSDCNLDRYAVGWQVDWSDPNQAGNLVGNVGGQDVHVGAVASADPKAHNAADNVVKYKTNPRCGVYDAGDDFNSGTWGPISHTYDKSVDLSTIEVCAVMYDVHQKDKNHPDQIKDGDLIAGGVGHNDDNSVEKNKNTPLGNQCFPFRVPSISTTASDDTTVGQDIHDTATLTGASATAGGMITFKLYAPGDTDCEGDPLFTDVVDVDGPGDYQSGSYTTDTTGVHRWIASYSGDDHHAATSGECNDEGENVTVSPASTLKLVKIVDNGETGADHVAADWTLKADGPTQVEGKSGTKMDVAAGDYTLTESGPSGYSASDWTCENGEVDGSVVTVPAHTDVTCTVTNTAIMPKLTLEKVVDNANTDGTAVDTDWTLTADGPTTISGVEGDDTITGAGVPVGSYDLSEQANEGAPSGYTDGTTWDCGGDHTAVTEITLSLGDDVTCRIVNTAQPGTFKVVKTADPVTGSTVSLGGVITYAVTLTKTGGVDPTNVVVTDDLAGVLSHADWLDQVGASAGTAQLNGTTLTWTVPALADTATLTYKVKVQNGPEDAGVTLVNEVTSPRSENCSPLLDVARAARTTEFVQADCSTTHHTGNLIVTPPVVTPPVVSPPEAKPPAALPNTGGPNLWLLVAGFVLLLGGGTLLAGDRMRRRRS
jgi:uncharacterized repeat protein (TIGR01451 family)/LPXTG-motif cell wall-anchored protein